MSTQSQTDFEWSVQIIADGLCPSFYIGIASKLQRNHETIDEYDENAILYCNCSEDAGIYSSTACFDAKAHESGDVIRFRFQPQRKKLLINLVSF